MDRPTPPADRARPFPSTTVGTVPFAVATLESAVDWLLDSAAPSRQAVNVRLANAYNVALASQDPEYGSLMRTQGVNFPDGTPVVWFMRMRRIGRNAERVRGPSFFARALEKSAAREMRHFFLGSTPETLSAMQAVISAEHPRLQIAGAYSPPFAPINDEYVDDCVRKIEAAEPDVVWLGLGTPKQDFLGTALAHRISVPSVNVGAAFDFTAGSVKEAPRWIQESGFEWLYRLATEPRRLWRRYVFGNVRFLLVAVRDLRRRDHA